MVGARPKRKRRKQLSRAPLKSAVDLWNLREAIKAQGGQFVPEAILPDPVPESIQAQSLFERRAWPPGWH